MKFIKAVTALLLSSAVAQDAVEGVTREHAKSEFSVTGSCCNAFSVFFGDKVSYPGFEAYNASLASYWSLQESAITPNCIFRPDNRNDVSLAVFLLSVGDTIFPGRCKFAVRSGGHTPFGGAANIDDGITFDLQKLNEVTVSSNKKTVRIGPGNRWGDVYLKLDALNLATSGGRVSIVGAGGLITGGGVSFFSPRYGYVCDNVENFEVVLASGQIVNANARSNPDLWRALRGGSNNFGIVTAFDMRTFPQGNFWGGFGGISISTLQQQFRAFEKLTGAKPYDPYAALIFSLVWDISTNTWSASHNFVYTKPEANPPVFQDFTSLPQVFNTTRISNLTDFAIEIARSSPSGRRQLFGTGTYKNSAAMMNTIYEIGNEVVQRLRSVPAIKWSLSFQPLPTVIQAVAATNGGNSLGLDESDGDLFNVLLTATWDTEAADGLVEAQAKQLFDRANAQASAIGVLNEYIYLNYAAPWQDPITGYGAAAKASLQAASRRYDPKGLFQRNVPGGFKLFD